MSWFTGTGSTKRWHWLEGIPDHEPKASDVAVAPVHVPEPVNMTRLTTLAPAAAGVMGDGGAVHWKAVEELPEVGWHVPAVMETVLQTRQDESEQFLYTALVPLLHDTYCR
jgi:hypothetical protein